MISLFVLAGFLAGFILFCGVLIHWVQAISGIDRYYPSFQFIAETFFLVLYTVLGIRFCRRKIDNF
ncbi:MAG: hypothetical protein BGO59_23895 [Spirosoma sp. 48-14]|nr:MAG: hypothetical protein BGO59_23895 [Spirosoma sp. 48-14]